MSERAKRIEEALGAFCPRCLRGDHSAHGSKITPNGCLWCRCGHLADCGCGGCEDLRAALAAAPDAPPATPRCRECGDTGYTTTDPKEPEPECHSCDYWERRADGFGNAPPATGADDECPDCNDGILTRAFAEPHDIPCPTCNGTMRAPPSTYTVCGADGVTREYQRETPATECGRCGGTGKRPVYSAGEEMVADFNPCPACGGTGRGA